MRALFWREENCDVIASATDVYRVSRDIERSFSMNNDPAISTTKGDTCIDAVFTRHVEYLQTMNFVSYFSYHKPLLSITAQPNSVTCDDIPVQ